MKSKLVLKSALLLLSIVGLTACPKSSSNAPGPSGSSRQVTYELTGTASGNINAIYFGESGAALSESAIVLPWSKSVTINDNVPAITLSTAVSNATPNQTLTAKIIVGGVVKVQQTATVGADGNTSIALPSYVF